MSGEIFKTIGKYTIYLPGSGGKAGAGKNITSSVQVRRDNCIVKQYRYIVGIRESSDCAIDRAEGYCLAHK